MKKLKIIIVSIVLLSSIGVLYLIYPILQISSTFAPLREYNYPISKLDLEKSLYKLSLSDSRITYKITDSTSTNQIRYKYYVTLFLKKSSSQNYEYNLNYEEQIALNKNFKKVNINLVGAFDKSKNTGGYKEEDKEVLNLINVFETDILSKINKEN
jgi:hypothetical protein